MAAMNDVKVRNILEVVKELRNKGPISKPEIAQNLGLTGASVHNFISELMEKGIAVEDGTAKSRGGRRAVLYNIYGGCGYLLGQDFSHTRLNTHLYDLKLNRLYMGQTEISKEYNLKVLDTMRCELEKALAQTGVPRERCLGIGVSIPGLVDHENGVVFSIPILNGWSNVPVKSYLEERLGIQTLVENDVNAMVLADKWVYDIPANGLVALSISRGMGAGIVTQDMLFRGAKSTAGEIGHTTIRYDGIPCTCGNRGCLDAYVRATEKTLIQKVEQKTGLEIGELDHLQVTELMEKEDTEILRIMEDFAEYVSIALDHIYKLYAPEHIVIHSDWLTPFRDLRYRIIDNLFSRNSWLQPDELRIVFAGVQEHLRYAGAVQVLDYIFNAESEMGRAFFNVIVSPQGNALEQICE